MITADQLLAHAIGDYILQSHSMATRKTSNSVACLSHVMTYGLPFIFLRPSLAAYLFIVGSHFMIDRWRLARYVIWLKNGVWIGPWDKWEDCVATGYHKDVPPWLSVWLLIITDNILHILCNGLALAYL